MNRKIIQVRQNTKEWREWRDKGLGASDAPVVMGESPWTSRFQLWAERTGLLSRPEANAFQVAAMQRGHDLEPEVRKRYEQKVGKKFPSTSFEHVNYPYLRASLDGFNGDLNRNLEIKCPSKVDHQTAIEGRIPKKYIPQLQMQMLVSGAESTDYVSWDGKGEIVSVLVAPDPLYQEKLLTEMISFWKLVVEKTPPKIGQDELLEVVGIVSKDLGRAEKSFKALALICEAITKGDKND